MTDLNPTPEQIAREHFYNPGPFNADKFARDFALFMILRKQCLRYLKTGQLNHRLALNNCIIALNSFGKHAVNDIVRLMYDGDQLKIILTILVFLRAEILKPGEGEESINREVLSLLMTDCLRFNLDH